MKPVYGPVWGSSTISDVCIYSKFYTYVMNQYIKSSLDTTLYNQVAIRSSHTSGKDMMDKGDRISEDAIQCLNRLINAIILKQPKLIIIALFYD